jgi:hypothetical protein
VCGRLTSLYPPEPRHHPQAARLLDLDPWLNVHVDFPLLQRIALPVTIGAVRHPGIKIHGIVAPLNPPWHCQQSGCGNALCLIVTQAARRLARADLFSAGRP